MIPVQLATAGHALVVDASAMVDVLSGQLVRERLVAHDAGRSHGSARALADFADFRIERHGLPPLTQQVWSLRDWLRVSDGYYVTLAEALKVPVLTTDRRPARALTDRGLVEVVDVDAC